MKSLLSSLLLLIPFLLGNGQQIGIDGAWLDPAACSASDCPDATLRTALQAFPHWDRLMWNDDGGTGGSYFLMGETSDGDNWVMNTCDHCSGSAGNTFCLNNGTHAGECSTATEYYSLQSTNEDLRPQGSGFGDRIWVGPRPAGVPRGTYPPIKMATRRVWENLPDDTYVLGIGSGFITSHDTLGWYAECNPDGSGHACCSVARTPAIWDHNEPDKNNCSVPLDAALVSTVICSGGEGNKVACDLAGLTYLGATHGSLPTGVPYRHVNSNKTYAWFVDRFYPSLQLGKQPYAGGSGGCGFYYSSNHGRAGTTCNHYTKDIVGASPVGFETELAREGNGYSSSYQLNAATLKNSCTVLNTDTDGIADPPTAILSNSRACGTIPNINGLNGQYNFRSPLSGGDSGGPTFVWFENEWWYAGAHAGPPTAGEDNISVRGRLLRIFRSGGYGNGN